MDDIYAIALSTLRIATPLMFAAMGGILSERSGVVNICLEGFMLVGAFAAATVAFFTGDAWLGFGAGALAGVALSAIYALSVVTFSAQQIVAGTAINLLAAGVTPLLCKAFFDSTGATASLPLESRFVFAPALLIWFAIILLHLWFKHTVGGLRLSFAGEKPEALVAAGGKVRATRWKALLASGFFAGLGGATLSIYLASSFTRNMSAGRGFMALAALILGSWKPIPAALGCLLFAFFEAVQFRLQGVVLFGEEPVPVQFIQVLPYVVTLVVLAGFIGRSRPPEALGSKVAD